jgi:hypothetical protein
MERVIGATEARVHFGELMRQVTEKQRAVVVGATAPQLVVRPGSYERAAAGPSGWEKAPPGAEWPPDRSARGGRPLPTDESAKARGATMNRPRVGLH